MSGSSFVRRLAGLGLAIAAVVMVPLGCDAGVPGDGGTADGGPGMDPPGAEGPAPSSRFPRLSHGQWERSVRDLLFLADDTDYASALRSDPNPGGAIFVQHGLLRVDQALWQGYQRVAEEVAQDVADDATLVEQLAPAGPANDERVDTFIRTHGMRAHRRPLSEAEVTAYKTLFDAGATSYPDSEGLDAFQAGVRIVVEAWLQSPHFLYRPELTETASGQNYALAPYEMASRLSFALWGTMPDDDLFAAAESGALGSADQIEAQALRMLADPRAEVVVEDFHARLFDAEAYDQLQPSPGLGASPSLGASLAEEHRRVVQGVFLRDEGLTELLTTTTTYANQELADLYGLDLALAQDQFTEVELDATQRRGILTMAGFLADHAAGGVPDPIHRGVFVSTRLVCNTVPAPPDDIPPYPAQQGQTNRELVESLTEVPGSNCAGCHTTLINPYGFPFETYDALGRWQTEDNGFPIDAASMVLLGSEGAAGGETVSVSNAVELSEALAGAAVVHECYAGQWLRFLYGRELDENFDAPIAERVGELSLQSRASVVDLIVSLVRSDAFRFRSQTEELP